MPKPFCFAKKVATLFGVTFISTTAVMAMDKPSRCKPISELDPALPPSENFDLSTWALDVPNDDDGDGRSDRISEAMLNDGYQSPNFFTAPDGGMRFIAPIGGAKSSKNTKYARSELREMLRRGNTRFSTRGIENNWALGYQPRTKQKFAGREGQLRAILSVDKVTTTGIAREVGAVVIGQIHASDDEPLRLYFKKNPQDPAGVILAAHEIREGDDIFRYVVGQKNMSSDELAEVGIRLGEKFVYDIINEGAKIRVDIRRLTAGAPLIGTTTFDMDELNSGYDIPEEWNYFKAGAYTQNHTGDPEDFDQVTFYCLINGHRRDR